MRQEVGSLIAAISGVLLVQVSAGGLQEVLQWPVRLVGIIGFLGVIWYVLRRWRASAPPRRPRSRREIRNYALWLGLILVAVVLGFLLFSQVLSLPALIVPLIVMLL